MAAMASADDGSGCAMMAKKLRRVFVIYTGGTIGMKPSSAGYVCAPGYLTTLCPTLPMFHDNEYERLSNLKAG